MSSFDRVVCACIVAIVAIAALIMLLYITKSQVTGAVSTGICPPESAPIISGEEFMNELQDFENKGFNCFFGYDGITPCCVRQQNV